MYIKLKCEILPQRGKLFVEKIKSMSLAPEKRFI